MIAFIGRPAGPMVARSGPGETGLWDDYQQRILASLVGASWRETFNWLVGEAVSLGGDGVKRAVEWPAVVPEQRQTGFPKANAGAGAGRAVGP